MTALWTKFCTALRAFRVARGGNVAITFVFATLPIIASVGFAVDYSRANSVKVAMQAALDSTALMLSKEAATDSQSQLQTNALKYFSALFTRPEATNVNITATYTTQSGSSVIVNGASDVPTSLLGIIGYNTITVTGSSTAKWGYTKLRVALVLDNTGSMGSDGKMAALQTATKNLLTQLKDAANSNGDVYVSIVPFVKDVNLGGANWNSDWIYWDDAAKSDDSSWDANNGTCSAGNYSSRAKCTQHASCSLSGYNSQSSCQNAGACSLSGYNSQNSCQNAGSCSISGKNSQSSCQNAGSCTNSRYSSASSCNRHGGDWTPGAWTAGLWQSGVWSAATWTPNSHNTWNGCVVDRGDPTAPSTGNYDTNVVAPSTTISATLYAAEQYGSCPQAVMGLSYDWNAMNSLVTNMAPAGNTNQAIGLQLGWMSLVGGGPFYVPPKDSNYTYTEVIILLSDGLNTEDRWYTNQNSIDQRQQLTCNNIKNAGVTLYTIQVNTGGDPTSTLLKSCASTSDKFFLLTSASQIVDAFKTIGTNLSNLYVAK